MGNKIVYASIGVAILELAAILTLAYRINTKSVSPDILRLTPAVKQLNGTVSKISGDTLTILLDPTGTEAMPAVSNGAPLPDPADLTYTVGIDRKTIFSRPLAVSLLNPTGYLAYPLSIKDVAAGDRITVTTATDLRTVTDRRVIAAVISLPPIANFLQGTIVSASTNTIRIHAVTGIDELDYFFTVTGNTEISATVEETVKGKTAPVVKKYAFADLKPNTQVAVWTRDAIAPGKPVEAVRIQPTAAAATATPAFSSPANKIIPAKP